MLRFHWLVLALGPAACSGSGTLGVPDSAGDEADTDTDADADADTDSDADTDVQIEDPAELTNVVATLDDDYETVIHVTWDQSETADVHVEFSFEDGDWRSSPERALAAGSHEELILGVPFQYDVTYRVVAANAAGTTTSSDELIRTGDVPSEMPIGTVLTADPSGWDPDMPYILVAVTEGDSVGSRTWTMLVDRGGRVSWAHRTPLQRNTMHPRISWHEDSFLIDHSSFFSSFDEGDSSEILELKIDGTEVRRVPVPGQHHPFTELPDGTIAYSQYQNVTFGIAADDAVVLVDTAGNMSQIFSCDDFLNGLGEGGWCGSNTLSYDQTRDVFLFSIFTHDSVVELEAATGLPTRWFGHINGSYDFNPAGSAFWYQHGGNYTSTGTLLLSTHASSGSNELMVREYVVDDLEGELQEVWNFGAGEGVVGRQMGEAHRLPGGNTLHNYGTHAVVREATNAGDVVWDIRWEDREYNGAEEHTVGRSAPVTVDLWQFAPDLP